AAELRALAWNDPLWREPTISVVQRAARDRSSNSISDGLVASSASHAAEDFGFGLDSLDEAALLTIDLEASVGGGGSQLPSAQVAVTEWETSLSNSRLAYDLDDGDGEEDEVEEIEEID